MRNRILQVMRSRSSVFFRAKVPASVHIFDQGGHGFGAPTDASGPGRFWPELFQDWLARQTF